MNTISIKCAATKAGKHFQGLHALRAHLKSKKQSLRKLTIFISFIAAIGCVVGAGIENDSVTFISALIAMIFASAID